MLKIAASLILFALLLSTAQAGTVKATKFFKNLDLVGHFEGVTADGKQDCSVDVKLTSDAVNVVIQNGDVTKEYTVLDRSPNYTVGVENQELAATLSLGNSAYSHGGSQILYVKSSLDRKEFSIADNLYIVRHDRWEDDGQAVTCLVK